MIEYRFKFAKDPTVDGPVTVECYRYDDRGGPSEAEVVGTLDSIGDLDRVAIQRIHDQAVAAAAATRVSIARLFQRQRDLRRKLTMVQDELSRMGYHYRTLPIGGGSHEHD